MQHSAIRVGASAESANGLPATIGASLDRLAQEGVDTVEIPLMWLELVANGRVMPERLRELKTMVADRPFTYSAHAAIGVNFTCDPAYLPLHMNLAKAHLDIAAEVGAEHMVIHTGFFPASSATAQIDSLYGQQRACLHALGDLAAERGVIVCVENIFAEMGNRLTASASQLAHELIAVGHSHIRACLDISHAAIHCDSLRLDLIEEIRPLIPLAKHVHVHDSFGRSRNIPVHTQEEALGLGIGDLHLPVGWGNLPFDEIVTLAPFPADTIFNIELNKHRWHGLTECIAATRRLAGLARMSA